MTFIGELRPYQEEPVARMQERGKILLAAEQGTGKTTMTIAAIENLMAEDKITEPGLVIALSTLKYQWADKIREFSDSTPLVIDGTPKQRERQYEEALNWWESGVDYVIVNYEQVINEEEWIDRLPRGFVVVDEASFIRGFKAKRSKATKRVAKTVPFRYALTGTPIENGRPEELFSIMEFVDADLFGKFHIFDKAFIVRNDNGWVSRYRNIPTFQKTLGQAMIRMRASDPEVAPYMPEVYDRQPMLVPLDRATREVYNLVVKELLDDLEQASAWGGNFDLAAHYGRAQQGSDPSGRLKGAIGQKILALQMLCNHPALLRISAEKYDRRVAGQGDGGSGYAAWLRDQGLLDNIKRAPKSEHTVKWVSQMLESDPRNKIVIFTRFVPMAHILGDSFGDQASIYTGELNAKQKDAALKSFQNSPDKRILVATDAGGFGLDIPQANLLLNYDLPDGAGLADQRDTRIVRTSSQFPSVARNWVFIKGSIDQYKHQRLEQKRAVAAAFVDAKGLNARGGVDMTAKSLTEWLKNNEV